MSDLPDRLVEALRDRYRLERELGRGGMATVWLARDLKHDRLVALKVLRPELAAALGPERFAREIEVAARLQHPHILALHDSGEADGFFYYVMPYVEGESLRDRLNRERQLPLDDALQIAREVADALAYAHSHDVVHRDIKPENILLESGHAVVADFGIARAISAAGSAKLTETGIALGTPAYMSPEQSVGEAALDGRSDLYALGCVLYEMLAGEPPFTGPTAQAIIAKRLAEPVPRVSVVREAVPAGVEAALHKALARTPADRFRTASEFVAALTKPATGELRPTSRGQRARWVAGFAAVTLLVATLGIILLAKRPPKAPARPDPLAINDSVVAVLPFRLVSPDTSSTLRHLALGLPDLFAMKITGEFGPRIAYPPTLQRLWKDAGGTLEGPLDGARELAVARTVGAGKLVRGTIVATDTGLVLTGEVVAVPSGAVRVRAVSVQGRPADWLPLVDQLAWRLLAQDQGVPADGLRQLSRFKPRAIQAYLAGNQAGMEGRPFYRAALAADSTMVAAALEVYATGEREEDSAYARFAWDHRNELTPAERAYLLALVGWRFGATRTLAEHITQFRTLVQTVPGSDRFWGELSGNLAWGSLAGMTDWAEETGQALETLARLNTKQANWETLQNLAFYQTDTVLIRQDLERWAANSPKARQLPAYRWRFALLRGDSVEAEHLLAAIPDSSLIPLFAVADGRGLRAADRVAAAMGDRLLNEDGGNFARSRGRYQEWRRGDLVVGSTLPPIVYATWRVRDALFLDGPRDGTVAAQAAFLGRVADGRASLPAPTSAQRAQAHCYSALWQLDHGDSTGAHRALRQLEREVERPYSYSGCGGLIAVFLTRARGGDVRAALLHLDSIVREAPMPAGVWALPFPPPEEVENLTLARLLAHYGDTARALAASRRRIYFPFGLWVYGSLPEFLREEGRLAALTGDKSGAIRAYTHYLALREDPDYAPWQAVRDSVRRELAQLER